MSIVYTWSNVLSNPPNDLVTINLLSNICSVGGLGGSSSSIAVEGYIALNSTGNVFTWTGNGSAPVGLTQIRGILDTVQICAINGFATGYIALDTDGNVYTWTGLDDPNPSDLNQIRGLLTDIQVCAIGGTTTGYIVLDNNGNVYTWSGNGSIVPGDIRQIQIPNLMNSVPICAVGGTGLYGYIALDTTGNVYTWSGTGDPTPGNLVQIQGTPLLPQICSVSGFGGGNGGYGVIDINGHVYTWSGLGLQNPPDLSRVLIPGSPVVCAISYFSDGLPDQGFLGLTTDGHVFRWLGLGSVTTTPTLIQSLSNISAIGGFAAGAIALQLDASITNCPTSISLTLPDDTVPSDQWPTLSGTDTDCFILNCTAILPDSTQSQLVTSGFSFPEGTSTVTCQLLRKPCSVNCNSACSYNCAGCQPLSSCTFTVTVSEPPVQQPTTTTLTASSTTATVGDPVTLNVTVTQSDSSTATPSPSGQVCFNSLRKRLACAILIKRRTANDQLTISRVVNRSTAAQTITNLAIGEHTITAVYEGDEFNLPSESDPVTITITAPSPARAQNNSALNITKLYDWVVYQTKHILRLNSDKDKQ